MTTQNFRRVILRTIQLQDDQLLMSDIHWETFGEYMQAILTCIVDTEESVMGKLEAIDDPNRGILDGLSRAYYLERDCSDALPRMFGDVHVTLEQSSEEVNKAITDEFSYIEQRYGELQRRRGLLTGLQRYESMCNRELSVFLTENLEPRVHGVSKLVSQLAEHTQVKPEDVNERFYFINDDNAPSILGILMHVKNLTWTDGDMPLKHKDLVLFYFVDTWYVYDQKEKETYLGALKPFEVAASTAITHAAQPTLEVAGTNMEKPPWE